MDSTEPDTVRCRTAGQVGRDEYLDVRFGSFRCGQIQGGIALQLSSLRGSFIVDFSDFERAYLAAKHWRDSRAVSSTVSNPKEQP